MKNTEAMNWQTFKTLLTGQPNLNLQFEYAADKFVDAAYHITEIKQAVITSVDCGGVLNSWTDVVVQLWEPNTGHATEAMKVSKALDIVKLVENKLQLNPLATVKIEFGNSNFDTRQMYPGQITASGGNLIVNLQADVTQCKAIERGGSCGTTASGEECCTPAVAVKPKVQLVNLAAQNTCTPGSGCC
ncbi:hypothetical protein BDD43_5221 [Mucilaginibacter gracilis]|uniref:Uncharacterized protein n=1 Tax=Mucilaginibacter gracilis TaxID=423350 RepID=A0A495J7V9_9SPHI|nr:DUF6428 family protein [Mucilaginibacter gracilis]RKR84967.1 hypothetical protein BDD43_5221 [Mucilaginibacter gracilis]